jgi:hypothetical protein
MKRTFDGMDGLLSQVARKLSERIPSDLQETLNVIYFPQIGFLTTVPIDPTTGVAVYDGGFENTWERMFSTEYAGSPSFLGWIRLIRTESKYTSKTLKCGRWTITSAMSMVSFRIGR